MKTKAKMPLLRRRHRVLLLIVAYILTMIANANWLNLIFLTGIDTFFRLLVFVQAVIVVWLLTEIVGGFIKQYEYTKKRLVKGKVIADKHYWWERRGVRIVLLLLVAQIARLLEDNPEFNIFGWLIVLVSAISSVWLVAEIVLGLCNLISSLFKRPNGAKTSKLAESSGTLEVTKSSKRKEK